MTRLPIDQGALRNVLEQLGRSAVGVDPMLGKVIQYGVAYHHAGTAAVINTCLLLYMCGDDEGD